MGALSEEMNKIDIVRIKMIDSIGSFSLPLLHVWIRFKKKVNVRENRKVSEKRKNLSDRKWI